MAADATQLERVRDWRRRNPNYSKQWHERNPHYMDKYRDPAKIRAHKRVERAIKAGLLIRGTCEHEDESCFGRIEAHHDDYEKPLEVRWLCQSHHKRHHAG